MARITTLEHEFVDELPDELTKGVLYISLPFATVAHLCCCGCGNKVYTPLRPNRWRLTYDGETISLAPSVGNWNFPCKSHYVITCGEVRWAAQMTRKEIEAVRGHAREMSTALYSEGDDEPANAKAKPTSGRQHGRWARIKHFFSH